MLRKLLRTDEVAIFFDIPSDRVTRMAREGQLPAIRCGRTWRFSGDQINAWMKAGGAGGWKRGSETERGSGQ